MNHGDILGQELRQTFQTGRETLVTSCVENVPLLMPSSSPVDIPASLTGCLKAEHYLVSNCLTFQVNALG